MADYLTAQQVVVILGISENTLNFWYRFKREHPDNEIAKLLPEYKKDSLRGKRYWKRSDLKKLMRFQQSIPKGRNGIMGTITQRYYEKEEVAHGKKSINSPGRKGRRKEAPKSPQKARSNVRG